MLTDTKILTSIFTRYIENGHRPTARQLTLDLRRIVGRRTGSQYNVRFERRDQPYRDPTGDYSRDHQFVNQWLRQKRNGKRINFNSVVPVNAPRWFPAETATLDEAETWARAHREGTEPDIREAGRIERNV